MRNREANRESETDRETKRASLVSQGVLVNVVKTDRQTEKE